MEFVMRPLLISSVILTGLTVVACQRTERYDTSSEVVTETYMHKYGIEVEADDWSNRGEHGQVISTLKNGVIVSKNYDAGMLSGESTYTFPHSEIIEKVEEYSNNQLVKETSYYITGVPREQKEYGPEELTITTWYENGTPQSVETTKQSHVVKGDYYTPTHQTEGRVVEGAGNRIVRDSYGLILYYDTIKNGQLTSRMTAYSDGLPKEVTPYSNGLVEGDKKTYYPGGEPNTVEHWEAGKQQGLTSTYQNGEKYSEVTYQDGMKQGLERRYRDGNTVAEEITWVNDQKHGPAYSYIGNTTQTTWYFQGQEVTKNRYDFLMSRPISPSSPSA